MYKIKDKIVDYCTPNMPSRAILIEHWNFSSQKNPFVSTVMLGFMERRCKSLEGINPSVLVIFLELKAPKKTAAISHCNQLIL